MFSGYVSLSSRATFVHGRSQVRTFRSRPFLGSNYGRRAGRFGREGRPIKYREGVYGRGAGAEGNVRGPEAGRVCRKTKVTETVNKGRAASLSMLYTAVGRLRDSNKV